MSNKSINELINDLDDIKYSKLIESLKELDKVIGHKRLKERVCEQIRCLVKDMKTGHDDDFMLHTALYGPPGVGKTMIGKILANIWCSLGYLRKTISSISDYDYTKILIDNNQQKKQSWLEVLLAIGFFILIIYIGIGILKSCYNVIGLYGILFIGFILLVWLTYSLYQKKNNTTVFIEKKHIDNKEIKKENNLSNEDNFVLTGREHFVGEYVGHTAIKTKKMLEQNRGKVIFIDEAYLLYNDNGMGGDTFGMEALTTLNVFMSEHPRDVIIIFAGYKDKMKKTIFKVQPGLERRCMWHFDCDPYNSDELYSIFKIQCKSKHYDIYKEDEYKIKDLFEENKDQFPNYGGDTERLFFYSKLANVKSNLKSVDRILYYKDVKKGFDELKLNIYHDTEIKSEEIIRKLIEAY